MSEGKEQEVSFPSLLPKAHTPLIRLSELRGVDRLVIPPLVGAPFGLLWSFIMNPSGVEFHGLKTFQYATQTAHRDSAMRGVALGLGFGLGANTAALLRGKEDEWNSYFGFIGSALFFGAAKGSWSRAGTTAWLVALFGAPLTFAWTMTKPRDDPELTRILHPHLFK